MGQGAKWTEAQRAARLGKLVERNRAGHTGARLYEDAAWVRDAYEVRGLSLRQMATESGCGLRTIARWMQTHGIETRKGADAIPCGEAHHSWRGGKQGVCPGCGSAMNYRPYGNRVCMACRDRSGENNPNWRGEAILVGQAHGRVKMARGLASSHSCQHCGGAAIDWAYDHADPAEIPSPDGPYSLLIDHYMPLCRRCHKRFDTAHERSVSG